MPATDQSDRLIRLLTVIGMPGPPGEMVERTLTVLSEVLAADMACIGETTGERVVVTTACGLLAEDPAVARGWPVGPAGREAIATGVPQARGPVAPADLPPALTGAIGTSGAWIPLSLGPDPARDLLMLFRRDGEPFTADDLRVLLSMAYRMCSAVEAVERGVAIERLAQAGPGLARHFDLRSLLDDAVVLFRDITDTDSAFIVTLTDGVFDLETYTGTDESIPHRWPRTTATMPNWNQLRAGQAYVGPRERLRERPDETDESPTVLCVPVMRDGAVIALLGATGHRARSFGKTGIEVATVLANYLSVAMANTALYKALAGRERELKWQASHDPLTGLANRTHAAQRIDGALARPDSGVGLMFCDIDKFKAINDRLGHEAGDELIQQVALRLAATVREGDLLARFGGDEFVFLLEDIHGLADLTDAGRRVQVSLADPIALRGERVEVTASIGAVLGRSGTTASVMLRNADAAMYVAKGQGPGRVEVFDDEAATRSRDRLDLRSELTHALRRGELSVVYQPIVELKTSRIRSFEALVRWTHPERGAIRPDVFVPMAEETGAIVGIGAWVLEQACERLAEWQRLFPAAGLTMGVNISSVQLEQSDCAFVDIMAGAAVSPRDVWLEVTERMETTGDIAEQVNRLREAGVHFALDDFGMSYSSLTYLRRFPVEGIKIDRTFVAPMTDDDTQRGIVRAILALGESLSVNVVAEGIETQSQLNALLDLGCEFGQGYLLSHPLTPAECTRALQAQA